MTSCIMFSLCFTFLQEEGEEEEIFPLLQHQKMHSVQGLVCAYCHIEPLHISKGMQSSNEVSPLSYTHQPSPLAHCPQRWRNEILPTNQKVVINNVQPGVNLTVVPSAH